MLNLARYKQARNSLSTAESIKAIWFLGLAFEQTDFEHILLWLEEQLFVVIRIGVTSCTSHKFGQGQPSMFYAFEAEARVASNLRRCITHGL